MADDEIPKHKKSMESVIKSAEEITTIVDTVAHDHGKTYYDTAEEVLRDDKGKINYNFLDANKHGDKYHKLFAKKMSEKYLDKVIKRFKLDPKKLSQTDIDELTHGFFGVNEGILLDMLAAYGPQFTHANYKEKHADAHVESLKGALVPRIYAHISAEDIPKILKDIGADKFVKGDLKDYAKPEYRGGTSELIQKHYAKGNLSHIDVAQSKAFSSFYKAPPKVEYVPKKNAA